MIPRIVHLTTKDGTLNRDETIILGKNKKIFHDWDFRVYGDAENLEIMEKYFPEFLEKYSSIRRGVMRADVIRCLYLYLWGGLYLDTDYQFYRMIPEKWLNAVCVIPTEYFKPDGTPYLGNCVFFSEKGYPFWYDYIRDLFDHTDFVNIKEEEIIGCTGPGGVTRFYLRNREKYPELQYTPKAVFHPPIVNHHLGVKKTGETVGAHYCFGSWREKTKSPVRRWMYSSIRHLQARGLNIFSFQPFSSGSAVKKQE